jgi:transposase
MSDLFGVKGRTWLADQVEGLPLDERLTVDAGLRQFDFTEAELAALDEILAADSLTDPDAMRLTTMPGVGAVTAIALLTAIGDIRRFKTPRHLVGFLGLDPRVRQSGNEPAVTAGSASRVPAMCAGCSSRPPGTRPGPPGRCAFHQRLAARRGANIATVAVARKLVIITSGRMPPAPDTCASLSSSPTPNRKAPRSRPARRLGFHP